MYEYDTRVHCFRQAGKIFILRGHGKALVVSLIFKAFLCIAWVLSIFVQLCLLCIHDQSVWVQTPSFLPSFL